MLEANTFRMMMLIGGVMTVATLVILFFVHPIVDLDENGKQNYENVMNVELEPNEDGEYGLSAYQAIKFSIQGKIRGSVSHY